MDSELNEYISLIKDYILCNYKLHFQDPIEGKYKYPFYSSGINYSTTFWDWGSWQTSIALRSVDDPEIESHEKGIVLNFLDSMDELGRMPILLSTEYVFWLHPLTPDYKGNIYKPVLATFILEISNRYGVEWIRDRFNQVLKFEEYYRNYQYDEESGLYHWLNDFAVGVDNDPTIFYRPYGSTGDIYLNSLMYQELVSVAKLAKMLDLSDVSEKYAKLAEELKNAIQNECYDPVDGYFYSADISLRKIDPNEPLHSGHPRFWHSLPIKISTWCGMLPLYVGAATKEQAAKAVEHYLLKDGLYSEYGIRSLGKNERMYCPVSSNNPSCWLGPVWINANYFTYIGLKKYGYDDLAKDLAIKTIKMMGKGLKEHGGFYEYYNGDTGEGIHGCGMHGWNFLVLELINDLEKGA